MSKFNHYLSVEPLITSSAVFNKIQDLIVKLIENIKFKVKCTNQRQTV